MKKYLLAFSTLVISFSSMAGGGAQWQPSVSPGYCIDGMARPQGKLEWKDIPACNEVISNGYAFGIHTYGDIVYEGGNKLMYEAVLSPGRGATITEPSTLNGRKFIGTGNSTTQWLKK